MRFKQEIDIFIAFHLQKDSEYFREFVVHSPYSAHDAMHRLHARDYYLTLHKDRT